jgi:diguanylate cyclase (GGDEF)-like protein
MVLDLRTIYVVCALVCLVIGLLQVLAYATGAFERWSAWWGASNLLVGIGSLGIGLRDHIPNLLSVTLANVVTVVGYIALLVAVRLFSRRRLNRFFLAVATAAAVFPFLFLLGNPDAFNARIAFGSVVCATIDLAILVEGVRLARGERLASAWILVGLFLTTAVIFAGRAWLAATGKLSGDSLFAGGGVHQWLAVTASVFVALRGITIVLMASERNRNRLMELAHHDPLTGALNRSGLDAAFARLSAAANPISALVIDIDHFKALNDTHGHAVGDRILCSFAAAARSQLAPQDILARQGGDEFVVILCRTALENAVEVAEGVRQAFHAALQYEVGLIVLPTLSIGVATARMGQDSLTDMLQWADEAVYRSKRGGRDRVEAYEPERDAA